MTLVIHPHEGSGVGPNRGPSRGAGWSSIPMRGQEEAAKTQRAAAELVIHPHEGSGVRRRVALDRGGGRSSIPMRGQELLWFAVRGCRKP